MSLAQTVCTVHPERPAAARCPGCRRFFCAGCVTEHEGRLTCAACIAKAVRPEPEARPETAAPSAVVKWTWLVPVMQMLAGLVIAWSLSWFIGRVIASIPSDFHDGTRWETRTGSR